MPTSDKIKLSNVRLSFPRLFKPRAFNPGQDPRFEATFLLDPSDKDHAAIIAQIEEVADGIAAEMWPKKIPAGLARCYGLAEDDAKKAEYDGYEGMFYISTSATTNTPPLIVDQGRNLLAIENGVEPKIPYAGCYVTGSITLWTQDNQFGKRINANLRAVQFKKDGEAFSGVKPVDIDDELDTLDDDEDDDSFLDD